MRLIPGGDGGHCSTRLYRKDPMGQRLGLRIRHGSRARSPGTLPRCRCQSFADIRSLWGTFRLIRVGGTGAPAGKPALGLALKLRVCPHLSAPHESASWGRTRWGPTAHSDRALGGAVTGRGNTEFPQF